MHEKVEAQAGPASGDLRAGAGLATAGALLLGAILTRLWGGPAVVPGALAIALLVFGAYLFALRLAPASGAAGWRRGALRHFESHTEPVFLTDLDGRLLGRNPAGRGSRLLDGSAAEAMRYRMSREARLNGIAVEPAGDDQRVVVTRTGARTLLWRLERSAPVRPPVSSFDQAGIPWLRIDGDDRVLQANAAAAALGGGRTELDSLLADGPLRPDGIHVLAGSGQAVRAVVVPGPEGRRDLLLMPLDGAEVSGLVPDHFLDELPVALARLEASGRLTYANKAARALLGERAQAGVNIADLIEGLGRPIAERLADTTRGRALGRSEIARGTADGQEIFLQVAFTRTVLDGAPSLLAVLSDATELKTLEAQFVQSQKMQAVGQLAGGVAHDFNNLLTAINGHCDLLLMRHEVADVEHGDLMQIRQNANRAAALVRQLLAFSRKQTLRPTVINLQDTLSELTHLLNRLLTDKVALKIEHGTDLAPVRVDERQIEQVIMNLVVNARDAMPRGGEVRITTRNVHLARDLHRDRAVILRGDYVVIEVAELGPRHPRGQAQQDLRAVLHDEAGRRGHRPRALDRLRHHQADRRLHLRREPVGAGGDLHHLPAGLRQGHDAAGARARAEAGPRPDRPRPRTSRRGRGSGALLRGARAQAARLHRRRGGFGGGGARDPEGPWPPRRHHAFRRHHAGPRRAGLGARGAEGAAGRQGDLHVGLRRGRLRRRRQRHPALRLPAQALHAQRAHPAGEGSARGLVSRESGRRKAH